MPTAKAFCRDWVVLGLVVIILLIFHTPTDLDFKPYSELVNTLEPDGLFPPKSSGGHSATVGTSIGNFAREGIESKYSSSIQDNADHETPGGSRSLNNNEVSLVDTLLATFPENIVNTSYRSLLPSEFALVQFDSRPLEDYWLASALWNRYYCEHHGHTYIFYTSPSPTKCMHGSEALASPWCKVRAMLQATIDYPSVKVFIYLDSDAVVDRKFEYVPLSSLFTIMQEKLKWDPNEKPMVFNQDGPCWWCKLIRSVGYTMCLNAGTVMWYRHPNSFRVLRDWWDAAMDPYEGDPIKRRFRIKWPWEQDRQMAVYNRTPEHIQVASQPEQMQMVMRPGLTGWCLSHLPGSGCFISHHCENKGSKQTLMRLYVAPQQTQSSVVSSSSQANVQFGIVVNTLKN